MYTNNSRQIIYVHKGIKAKHTNKLYKKNTCTKLLLVIRTQRCTYIHTTSGST